MFEKIKKHIMAFKQECMRERMKMKCIRSAVRNNVAGGEMPPHYALNSISRGGRKTISLSQNEHDTMDRGKIHIITGNDRTKMFEILKSKYRDDIQGEECIAFQLKENVKFPDPLNIPGTEISELRDVKVSTVQIKTPQKGCFKKIRIPQALTVICCTLAIIGTIYSYEAKDSVDIYAPEYRYPHVEVTLLTGEEPGLDWLESGIKHLYNNTGDGAIGVDENGILYMIISNGTGKQLKTRDECCYQYVNEELLESDIPARTSYFYCKTDAEKL